MEHRVKATAPTKARATRVRPAERERERERKRLTTRAAASAEPRVPRLETMVTLGVVFPPHQPPARLREVALAAEDSGVPELWLWEDCFYTSGLTAASAALSWTTQLRVGIGLMPVPLRNVALSAMEIATMAQLFPERFLAGIGHGVPSWMAQAGAAVASPLTLLDEYATALRALLNGETVSRRGVYVQLDQVQLAYPPASVPPLLIGAIGPKTLALAGEVGDGVLLVGQDRTAAQIQASITTALEARAQQGIVTPFNIGFTAMVPVDATPGAIIDHLAPLAEIGINRIAICGVDADGTPDNSEHIVHLAAAIGEVIERSAGMR